MATTYYVGIEVNGLHVERHDAILESMRKHVPELYPYLSRQLDDEGELQSFHDGDFMDVDAGAKISEAPKRFAERIAQAVWVGNGDECSVTVSMSREMPSKEYTFGPPVSVALQEDDEAVGPNQEQKPDALETAAKVIEAINRIPGDKSVTLSSSDSVDPCMELDVSATGDWGQHFAHLEMFRAKLLSALESGSIVVRRFLAETYTATNGRALRRKVLYGAAFCKGFVLPIGRDGMKSACNTDAETEQPLEEEPGVEYGSFADFLDASWMSSHLKYAAICETNRPHDQQADLSDA